MIADDGKNLCYNARLPTTLQASESDGGLANQRNHLRYRIDTRWIDRERLFLESERFAALAILCLSKQSRRPVARNPEILPLIRHHGGVSLMSGLHCAPVIIVETVKIRQRSD